MVTDSATFPGRRGQSKKTHGMERHRVSQDPAPRFPFSYSKNNNRDQPGRVLLLSSPVQEGIAEGVELPEGFLGVHHQGVARDDPLHLALHHCNEGVGGWLGPNPHARKVLFQQVPGRREQHSHTSGILQTG